jgi:hypothetical protein
MTVIFLPFHYAEFSGVFGVGKIQMGSGYGSHNWKRKWHNGLVDAVCNLEKGNI